MDKQKDFDKDINVRSKMVEEMYKSFLRYKFQIAMEKFTYKGLCEHFYDLGYRKIPENAVVLTREDYELLTNDLDKCDYGDFENGYSQGYTQGSKETAEKFAEMLKELVLNYCGTVEENGYFTIGKKGFCREIDEICKEITEGKV